MCKTNPRCLCRDIPDDHWIERLKKRQRHEDNVVQLPARPRPVPTSLGWP